MRAARAPRRSWPPLLARPFSLSRLTARSHPLGASVSAAHAVSAAADGQCPTGRAWRAPSDQEATSSLALKHLNAWSVGHGWFFWNFKTELEPKWDYIRSVANGWLPSDAQGNHAEVYNACEQENSGHVACVARPDAGRQAILEAVTWACENAQPPIAQCDADADGRVLNASLIFTQKWHSARLIGGTCDFNGAAELADMDKIGLVIVPNETVAVPQRAPEIPPGGGPDGPEAAELPTVGMARAGATPRGGGRSPVGLAAPLAAVGLLALAAVGARAGARGWRARRAAEGDYARAEGEGGTLGLDLVGARDGERLLAL